MGQLLLFSVNIRAYQMNKKNLMKSELSAPLTLSNKCHLYLVKVLSDPLQETLDRLGKALDRFFKKKTVFLSRKHINITTRLHSHFLAGGFFRKRGKLLISKLSLMDILLYRKLDGKVKKIIKRQNGCWFAIFCVERQSAIGEAGNQ